MDPILNEVKDCDKIPANSQSLDVDKDCFASLLDGKTDPSEKVASQYKALSLDEMKDFSITSKRDDEALAAKYSEAGIEKLRNMTVEETDAVVAEACRRCAVAVLAIHDANAKAEEAVRRFLAIEKPGENSPRTECSHQAFLEADKESTEMCDAARRVIQAANRTVAKSQMLIEAISKAQGKRLMIDCRDCRL